MSYHLTHLENLILCEPEFEFFETEFLDDFINEILTEFDAVAHVVLYLGNLDFLSDEDTDQLVFLNEELVFKKGNLHIVSLSENIKNILDKKMPLYSEIDEAIDEVDSLEIDKELQSED
ncbi:MAG: hypothetical protein H6605_03395 [Flavobacteriales bacterium]|nr:hypothetical protein [Flavobacteriales bacterium]